MLVNLLPGLRELRAPLAAGYIWLSALWLVFRSSLPPRAEPTGIIGAIYSLATAADAITVGIVASFTAYLVGSLSQGVFDDLLRAAAPFVRTRLFLRDDPASGRVASQMFGSVVLMRGELSRAGVSVLSTFIHEQLNTRLEKLEHRYGNPGHADLPLALLGRYLSTLFHEFRIVQTRLVGQSEALFAQHDRLRAEAEFRRALIVPLAVLIGVVAHQTSWFWLSALLVMVLLYRDAVKLQESAGDILADAIGASTVTPPLIERLDRDVGVREQDADLKGRDFSGRNLIAADFGEVDLTGANLSWTNLFEANLKSSTISDADLSWAYLERANLEGATLKGANLERANLADALMRKANLQGANLERANLEGADLTGVDLTGVDLTDANLTTDLRDAVLTSVDLTRARLSGLDFTGADLTDANLTDADLTDADLTGADLTGADLMDANLTGADLTGANLRGVDLTGVDLTDADLTDADLTDADLTGAKGLTARQVTMAVTDDRTRLPTTNP
jgi:uncharacterized protein YjbI with pentapeptide repeats